MLGDLAPRVADNRYRGIKLGLWLYVPLLLLRAGTSVASVFNAHDAASLADGIPVDTFGAPAARAFLSLFMLLGWSNLMVVVLGLIVLLRYRSLIPAMLAVWLVADLGKRAILAVAPIERTVNPGLAINLTILGLTVLALVLSLMGRRTDALHHAPAE